MMTKDLSVLAVLSVLTVCVTASSDHGYNQLEYRNTATDELSPKPVRDDGLGSLLLKNLRFRDIERSMDGGDHPLANSLLWELEHMENGGHEENIPVEKKGLLLNHLRFRDLERSANGDKRSGVSVSQLAELLHSLKSRGIDDDGVKLQSLRFGRK